MRIRHADQEIADRLVALVAVAATEVEEAAMAGVVVVKGLMGEVEATVEEDMVVEVEDMEDAEAEEAGLMVEAVGVDIAAAVTEAVAAAEAEAVVVCQS